MNEKMPGITTILQLVVHLIVFGSIYAQNVQITPPNGAFILRQATKNPNEYVSSLPNSTETTDIYLQNGCAYNADQAISQRMAGRAFYEHVYPAAQNLHCTVSVKIAKEHIYIDRPYIDIVILRDPAWISLFKHRLCVTVQLTNLAGASVAGSCIFHEKHPNKHSCLIRQLVPFSWFQLKSANQPSEYIVSVSYSVKRQCSPPDIPLYGQRPRLMTTMQHFSAFAVNKQVDKQLSLLIRQNLTFSPNSMSSFIFHFKKNQSSENSTDIIRNINLKVFVDDRFELVDASALDPKSWRLRVETESEPKKHTILTLGYNGREPLMDSWEQYVMAILIRYKSRPESLIRANAMIPAQIQIQWNVEYEKDEDEEEIIPATTSKIKRTSKYILEVKKSVNYHTIIKNLAFSSDRPYAIVPITKTADIVNTAVLTGVQVSTPMRVYLATESGQLQDVTDKSTCHASEARLLKVAPTCTSVYVDGSELRGRSNVQIEVTHQNLTATAQLTVWYPKLPITIWSGDEILNAVNDWRISGWQHLEVRKKREKFEGLESTKKLEEFEGLRRKRDATQNVCEIRYQQTEIRILASFHVVEETTGEQRYLSGSRNLFFDVTQLALQRVHSSNPEVISLRRRDGRILAMGHQPGQARISIKSAASTNVDYGYQVMEVTSDRVSAAQLFVKVVADVQLQLLPKPGLPYQFELMARTHGTLTQKYQHASLDIYVFYSDGQKELLSDIDTNAYAISIYTENENALKIGQQRGSSNVELVLLQDVPQLKLTVEIRSPSTCDEADVPALAAGIAMIDTGASKDSSETQHIYVENTQKIELNVTTSNTPSSSSIGLQSVLATLLVILLIVGIYHLVTGHMKGFHNGYEKLVMPLLARLSSNGSLISENVGEGENTSKEFVWLPRSQLDNMSVGSHFSQRSTLHMSNNDTSTSNTSSSSSGNGTNRSVSVSYRGSEISVFISPQTKAAVSVNEELRNQHSTSWRSTNGRTNRVKRNNFSRNKFNEGTVSVHDRLSESHYPEYAGSSLNTKILRRSSDHSNVVSGNNGTLKKHRHIRQGAPNGYTNRFNRAISTSGQIYDPNYPQTRQMLHHNTLNRSHDYGRPRPKHIHNYGSSVYYQEPELPTRLSEYDMDSGGSSPEEMTPPGTITPNFIPNWMNAGSIEKIPRASVSPRKPPMPKNGPNEIRETIA